MRAYFERLNATIEVPIANFFGINRKVVSAIFFLIACFIPLFLVLGTK
ncbi:MAG: hypothetical protein AAB388_01495 [Patescibacteria group bacterium]